MAPSVLLSRRTLLAASLALAGCQADTAGLEPLRWQKVPGPGPGGAVLGPPASATAFDFKGNFTVRAFKDGSVYRLYYGGSDDTHPLGCTGINDSHWRIGLAESDDGLDWRRVAGTETGGAILDNGAGHFDSYLTYRPFVLKDVLGDGSVLYRMWYNGSTKPFFDCTAPAALALADDRRIGYAESPDGVHWTRSPYDGAGPDGSVLPLGAPGEIDAQQVGYVWVLKDGGEYKMYYSANDANNVWRVALAVSTDARAWTKVRGKIANGSILDVGPAGSFDVACAYQPSVVKERDQLYRMWYRGCQAPRPVTGGPSQGVIGYAESNDGRTWVKILQGGAVGEALAKGAAGEFDSGGLTTPSVFLDGDVWSMYYAGFDTGGNFATGLARAPRR